MAHADVKHDYHLVNPSPWPVAASISALLLTVGLVVLVKGALPEVKGADFANNFLTHGKPWIFGAGIIAMAFTLIGWWGDVIKEGRQGDHTPVVDIGLRYGMILFIASEVMFFVAWFWMFFELAIFHTHRAHWFIPAWDESTAAAWASWPPPHVDTFDPFHLPLMNTLILLLSGTSWSGAAPGHHLQIPVGALLRARQAEVDAIAQSRFEYRPFFDSVTNKPLRVSGNRSPQDRRSSLFKILAHLAGPGRLDRGPSRLDRDLQALPERRRRALLLVGSYVDARAALQDLIQIDPSWRDRAVCLIPDDDDEGAGDEYISTLRRGEVERFGRGSPDVLIAPLMAVERGHNILNEEQRAAVGAVYMLVRPMPRPDDISFPVLFLNRWAVERSTRSVEGERSVAQDGAEFRQEAFDLWRRLLGAPMSWAGLDQETREALTWSQLVSLWQVIGRLVRGGEPARVYFVDAAFAPHSAADAERGDSPTSSILLSLRAVLDPYFTDSSIPSREREIARTLYGPLREALSRLEGVTIDGHV